MLILLVVDLKNPVVLLVTDRSTDRPTGKYRHTNMWYLKEDENKSQGLETRDR